MTSYDDGGFSQSRGDDDLFDDDFTPLEPSEQQTYTQPSNLDHSTEQLHNLALEEATKPVPTTQYRGNNFRPRGPRGSNRARTRGGRDRTSAAPAPSSTDSSLQQSKYAPAQPTDQKQSTKALDSTKKEDEASPSTGPASPPLPSPPTSTDPAPPDANTAITPSTDDPTPPPNAPSAPNSTSTPSPAAGAARPPAVRGSRLLTGGPLRPKLTEAELTEKIASARARSQQLSTAHARAEADAASFAERERVASEKRERERVNRRVLEGERERNRERKMRALAGGGGREWDEGKEVVEGRQGGRGGGYMRGVFGGVGRREGGAGVENGDGGEGERERARGGRGRGYRSRGGGGGGGGGRGRGGHNKPHATSTDPSSTSTSAQQQQADISAETDFPSLPTAEKPRVETAKPPPPSAAAPSSNTAKPSVVQSTKATALETPISPGGDGSWADQVDRVEAARGEDAS